jgi:hypothetical protein
VSFFDVAAEGEGSCFFSLFEVAGFLSFLASSLATAFVGIRREIAKRKERNLRMAGTITKAPESFF